MRERRPTGYSPSGMNWPTGYTKDRVSDDEPTVVIGGGGCWCGLPFNHDWPGKNDRPRKTHPREKK